MKLQLNYSDGGRSKYFKADNVRDCVVRSIAIVTGLDYKEVYDTIRKIIGESPRNGVSNKSVRKIMDYFGGVWIPLSGIGTGCKAHLCAGEIPMDKKIICNISKHVVAVINGVIYDTYDCSRSGNRCVYGYWMFN